MGLFSKVSKSVNRGVKSVGKIAKKTGSNISRAGKKALEKTGNAMAVINPATGLAYSVGSSNFREGFFKGIGSQIGTASKVIGKAQEQVPAAKALIGQAKTFAQSAQEIAASVGVSIPGLDMLGAGAAPQGSLFTPEPTTMGGNGGDDNTIIYLAIGAAVLVGVFLYMRKN
jgi:hypothetical protein